MSTRCMRTRRRLVRLDPALGQDHVLGAVDGVAVDHHPEMAAVDAVERRAPAPGRPAARCGGDRRSGRRWCRSSGRAVWAKATRSGSRAMVPSSFMISQITPGRVERRPGARCRPPPRYGRRAPAPRRRLATSGKTWPGETMSSAPLVGSMATATVWARSWAEMPVVTPSLRLDRDGEGGAVAARGSRCAIGGRRSWRARSAVMARQIRPRACLAMKLIWPRAWRTGPG